MVYRTRCTACVACMIYHIVYKRYCPTPICRGVVRPPTKISSTIFPVFNRSRGGGRGIFQESVFHVFCKLLIIKGLAETGVSCNVGCC